MRFVVLFFGFAACLLTACIGVFFIAPDEPSKLLQENGIRWHEFLIDDVGSNPGRIGIFLLIAAGYGLIGTLLGFFRCGWQGSLLHAVPIVGAAVLEPFTVA